MKYVILEVILKYLIIENIKYYINLIGRFVIGGLVGDSGLIGCKFIVDIYGGYLCYGGGVFSGKDVFKVDRLVFYMVRYLVK